MRVSLTSRNWTIPAVSTLLFALAACSQDPVETAALQKFLDREAIEQTLDRANLGFELSDADLFASAFAEDAEYILDSQVPVYGYDKLQYQGRDAIRSIVAVRAERAAAADPATLSYDPASLRRYNRISNPLITILDGANARYTANWMVTMKTNVDIHISAIGRYEDELVKRDGEWLIKRRIRVE